MKLAFFISSVGDTDLALNTIRVLESQGKQEVLLISLTKTARDRVADFNSKLISTKISLPELLNTENNSFPAGSCSEDQLNNLVKYVQKEKVDQVYCGVPSANSKVPFQIAATLEDIPILMAYEFMYKPETHDLWSYLPALKNKPNIHWALPLEQAITDFEIKDKSKLHIIGHLSIDNAFSIKPAINDEELANRLKAELEKSDKTRKTLQIAEGNSFAFVSSTTQPVAIDSTFLNSLLTVLPKHPNMVVRLGLHPGIENLDAYLIEILKIYKKHQDTCKSQFKIIVTDSLFAKLKEPELTVTNPDFEHVFIRANVSGNEAAAAADRVAQAVPGALLNQGVLEGKPSYTHFGKPYLPEKYFSNSLTAFFSEKRQMARSKKELGLDEKTAPECCAEILLNCEI
ncbi:Uncharacterised protein [Legionella steigerwaltii]|uniref:Uncharacterized protein n=1 Tax=Legionella steigerwaltii TaxID=460 RepID=A0A378L7L7_9GAMM|nr:hypothetical protein [Legionella steigerwaltii]KTD77755.1 hypothetical protein Lstg_2112 [Legionella steigerwaltii]STY23065.1 Uncharacterised protein [Legionella steigerwaltii]